jgi:hypothetical protein
VKFCFAFLRGALFGRYIAADHARWFQAGQDAFLSYQSHRFDLYLSRQNSGLGYIGGCAIFALGLAVLYEFIGIVAEKAFNRSRQEQSLALKRTSQPS